MVRVRFRIHGLPTTTCILAFALIRTNFATVSTATLGHIRDWDKDHMDKKKLLAAAEANGIKVYKSWSKPRIWKALLSA